MSPLCKGVEIGYPPNNNQQPPAPTWPNPPSSASEFAQCKWAFLWTSTNLGNIWMYVTGVDLHLGTVIGCVLFRDQSGRLYYENLWIDIRYISMYRCDMQFKGTTMNPYSMLQDCPEGTMRINNYFKQCVPPVYLCRDACYDPWSDHYDGVGLWKSCGACIESPF
jgi:hypothetical protein